MTGWAGEIEREKSPAISGRTGIEDAQVGLFLQAEVGSFWRALKRGVLIYLPPAFVSDSQSDGSVVDRSDI